MPIVSLTHIRNILLPILGMSPEAREAAKREADRIMAIEGAAETARYNALSPQERAEYDALTEGMMPRLRKR
jgi:hypothetical protein